VKTLSRWFLYAVLIIFAGGIIVIFLYMARLASNEKFMLGEKFFPFALIFLGVLGGFCLDKEFVGASSVGGVLFGGILASYFFLTCYLLLALLLVVKFRRSFIGTLKKKF